MTWSTGKSLRGGVGQTGPRGNSFASGTTPPGVDFGADGDTYLDRAARQFHLKTGGRWSPVGLAYATLSVGTAIPGTNFGSSSDSYIRIADGVTTFWQKSGITWSQLATLTGRDGAPGLGVLSGDGPPAPSLGAVGQPGYIDSKNLTLYGAKTAAGWPASASFAPIRGERGETGPASPGLYSGSGAPSATTPANAQPQSYYIRNDVVPALLYGPRNEDGTWGGPQNTGGSQTRVSYGPPAADLGSLGDVAYDLQNSFFYPPKQTGGWTLPPINMQGPPGPSMQVQPPLGNLAVGFGPAAHAFNYASTRDFVPIFVPGSTNLVSEWVASHDSAFMGAQITNYGASGGSFNLQLFDVSDNKVIWANPTAYVRGSINPVGPFAADQFPMPAGHTYQWRLQGTPGISITGVIQPSYLFPANGNVSVGQVAPAVFSTPTTLSATGIGLAPAGVPGQGWYYANPRASFLQALQVQVGGTGTATFTFNNTTPAYKTPALTAGTHTFGPFGVGAAYVPAGANTQCLVTGTGSVTACVTPTFCQ